MYFQERYCYVCPDVAKEFSKFDEDPRKNYLQYTGTNAVTKKPFTVDVGHERFLGPEIFFNPEVRSPWESHLNLLSVFVLVRQSGIQHLLIEIDWRYHSGLPGRRTT